MANTNSKYAVIGSLLLVQLIDVMGMGIILPVLAPLFVHPETSMLAPDTSLFLRNLFFGLSLGIFAIFNFFGSPFMGDLSDKIGRKKVLILCLLGVAISFWLCALAIYIKSVTLLLVARAIGGFAAGNQTIAQAAIVDISTDEEKARNLSLITLATCIGFVIGPLFTAFLSKPISGYSGFALPFLIAGFLAVVNASLLLKTFKETFHPVNSTKVNIWKGLLVVKVGLSQKNLAILFLAFFMTEYAWSIYFQYISLYLSNHFDYDAHKIGYFMAAMGLGFGLTMTLIIRWALRLFSLIGLVRISLILMTIGYLLSALLKNELAQWLILIPFTIGAGLSYVAFLTIFSNRVSRLVQGMIMGVLAAIISICWGITGVTLSLFIAISANFPLWLAFYCALIGTLAAFVEKDKKIRVE